MIKAFVYDEDGDVVGTVIERDDGSYKVKGNTETLTFPSSVEAGEFLYELELSGLTIVDFEDYSSISM